MAKNESEIIRKVPRGIIEEVKVTFYLATPYLKATRLELNLSIREIADRAGVSTSFYHDFERMKTRAQEDFVNKIFAALNKGFSKEIKEDDQ